MNWDKLHLEQYKKNYNEDFEKIKLLGSGVSSNVFLIQDKASTKFFALKEINIQSAPFALYNEIQLIGKLKHRNVISTFKLFFWHPFAAISMEYMELGTLHDISMQYKFNESETSYIYGSMLDALSYIHDKGVVHRDISMENILINGDGIVKLSDFGLSMIEPATVNIYNYDYRALGLIIAEILMCHSRNTPDEISKWWPFKRFKFPHALVTAINLSIYHNSTARFNHKLIERDNILKISCDATVLVENLKKK